MENVMQILNIYFYLRPNGEWSNEAEIIFNSNKATLHMTMVEFKEVLVL